MLSLELSLLHLFQFVLLLECNSEFFLGLLNVVLFLLHCLFCILLHPVPVQLVSGPLLGLDARALLVVLTGLLGLLDGQTLLGLLHCFLFDEEVLLDGERKLLVY